MESPLTGKRVKNAASCKRGPFAGWYLMQERRGQLGQGLERLRVANG